MTVIRDAGPEDAETLQKIYDWYVRNTAVTFEYETPTAAQFRERMERTMERYPYLIAETDGRADGYCYAGPFVGRAAYDWSCELSIYLRPDVRRNGIGRMLYGEMERRLRAMESAICMPASECPAGRMRISRGTASAFISGWASRPLERFGPAAPSSAAGTT